MAPRVLLNHYSVSESHNFLPIASSNSRSNPLVGPQAYCGRAGRRGQSPPNLVCISGGHLHHHHLLPVKIKLLIFPQVHSMTLTKRPPRQLQNLRVLPPQPVEVMTRFVFVFYFLFCMGSLCKYHLFSFIRERNYRIFFVTTFFVFSYSHVFAMHSMH